VSVEAEHKESRISRFLARRWAVPGVIAGAVAIVSLACLTPDLIARWQLPRERDRIRARGEPATLAELAPEMPPDDENAAVLLTQAFKLMDAARVGEPADWTEFLREDADDRVAHRADAAAAVKLQAKAMALAREALKRPRCVFELDYANGDIWDLPYGGFAHLAKLFAAGAILEAMRGDPVKATDSLRVVFSLVNALNECDRASGITAHVVFASGIKALARAKGSCAFGDGERRMLLRSISSIDWQRAATDSYLAERILIVDAARAIVDAIGARDDWLSRVSTSRQSPLSHGERLRAWRLYSELIEASRLPPWEARGAVRDCYGRLMNVIPWLSNSRLDEPMTDFYVPYLRAMATRGTAVLGLSCELFRSGAGRYPAKLDELAPDTLKELPPDPFTGKPFRYELRDDGRAFIVYSVGSNLKDDGGVERDYEKAPKSDDIPWEGRAATTDDETRGE
jgi:hypothetical protein